MAIPAFNQWVIVICTLAIYSYILYKENVVYRFAEATLIGIAIGNMTYMAIRSLITSGIQPFLGGQILLIIPLIIGPLFFLQHVGSPYNRLARWPVAMLSGIGLAVAIRGSGHTYIYNQVKASFVPLTFNNAIIIICLTTTLFYFMYTFDVSSNPTIKRIHSFGRYAIMIYLGAMFGSVTMSRLTYITGRVEPLVNFFMQLLGFS
jgi:hypothetical protein